MKIPKRFPPRVVPRLSRYYRFVSEKEPRGWTSSKELAEFTGFTAAQVRRDLGYFGQFGHPGRGYNNEELAVSLRGILGLNRRWHIALFGVGNLGKALLGYKGFKEQGFDIIAAFDPDPRKAGKKIGSIDVLPVSECGPAIRDRRITMAIITAPREAAQGIAEEAVSHGVKAILNFAPVSLKLPSEVKVRNIDLSIEIERLSFLVSKQ